MPKGVGGIRPLGIVGMAGPHRFIRGRLLLPKGKKPPQKNKPQVVRMENMRKTTPRQLACIQHLKKREGKDSFEMDE